MRRLGSATRLVVAIVIGAVLSGAGLATTIQAAAPDKSEVVLVLDFSASILNDKANREQFADALERMADRVDATSADLVAGDATVSLVQFAAKAAAVPGCTDLGLLANPAAVAHFADCLRSVATAYRKGLDPALTKKIGTDTNYVAAMEQAARHLPKDAVRPAMILFTDGKHDVKGVPVSQVQKTLDRLFGDRTPFALLPVGMGLDPKDRGALESGLNRMRTIRDMPACVSGATFDWPQVVFQSAEEAGNAVAVALQDATCTFTVAPTASPSASSEPTPGSSQAAESGIAAVRNIDVTAGDGRVEMAWSAPPATTTGEPIIDYRSRCKAVNGEPIESTEGVSLERRSVVEGLTNGTAYQCEVAAIGTTMAGPWTVASNLAIPVGPPAAPIAPSVSAQDQAVDISLPGDADGVSGYHYECSGDQGTSWPNGIDVTTVDDPAARIAGLTNGIDYLCRAYAVNSSGRSKPSPTSAARPCGSAFECTPLLGPIVGFLGLALAIGLLLMVVALIRGRRRGYVLAVVDVVHTANLGFGSNLGIGFIRNPESKRVTDIVADGTKTAEIRIRHRGGGRFEVTDRHGKTAATDGVAFLVTDSLGGRHEVVLRAFNTNAASPVATRH